MVKSFYFWQTVSKRSNLDVLAFSKGQMATMVVTLSPKTSFNDVCHSQIFLSNPCVTQSVNIRLFPFEYRKKIHSEKPE